MSPSGQIAMPFYSFCDFVTALYFNNAPSSIILNVGQTDTLYPVCDWNYGTTAAPDASVWSSNTSIASVSPSWGSARTLSGVGQGSANIQATAEAPELIDNDFCSLFWWSAPTVSAQIKLPPHHLHVVADVTGPITVCPTTVFRSVRLQVVDFQHTPVGSTSVQESYLNQPINNTCGSGSPTPTVCSVTDTAGRFYDTFQVGCNSVGGSCGFALHNRWSWCPAGVALGTLLNDVRNNQVTVEGYTGPIPTGTEILP